MREKARTGEKIIKFHGTPVANIQVLSFGHDGSSRQEIETFDAAKDPLDCEAINVQVVSDFVTITFYRNEKTNSSIQRRLIPTHRLERILVEDLDNADS